MEWGTGCIWGHPKLSSEKHVHAPENRACRIDFQGCLFNLLWGLRGGQRLQHPKLPVPLGTSALPPWTREMEAGRLPHPHLLGADGGARGCAGAPSSSCRWQLAPAQPPGRALRLLSPPSQLCPQLFLYPDRCLYGRNGGPGPAGRGSRARGAVLP